METAVSIATVKLVQPFEGFSATPYQDPVGVWTIGFGSTRDAFDAPVCATTPPITRAQALVPSVIDFAADLRFDDSATTEMVRDRETKCRKEVCGEAQPR
ncbi:glycoside hydrolase family protein, partial [Acidiphilium iwatense]|nr:hypothetical protein [Acidiphilium iwatense]